ncbi:universal stress protein [Streptomyces sp. TLI_146]|uniref:universal stress protein n=1 Tax=Streptomyces sp. TLI_146 TaxID=1938858 RepID=UPI000C7023DC|nr:universal stress protein [Streptomyces sp. TLI_146]PKV83152.1 nucleotide-binding universal stress UspA family protein [Streptomyces sp. TLI_146]
MQRHITAGVDGSRESVDAADWAAREAVRRGLPLHLLHVDDEPTPPTGLPELDVPGARERTALDRVTVQLAQCHPGLEIHPVVAPGPPTATILEAAATSEMLVLGSRGFTGCAAFLVGSVALQAAARAAGPVVLVRAGECPEGERQGGSGTGAFRPVVLGLDLDHPCDELFAYAFDAAATRQAPLHVRHAWAVPLVPSADAVDPAAEKARALTAALARWRRKFPETEVVERTVHGRAGRQLVMASTRASLLVIGRRTDRLGPVAHTVIHHVLCPVAVVPHE